MAINNEELMGKFVRTGMIMRHIDGEEGRCRKHGKRRHGEGLGPRGPEGDGPRGPEGRGARFEMGPDAEHPHGPHGHGPEGRLEARGRKDKRRRGQARVLCMVALKEGINQKDLAFLLGIRPQTLGEMLQRLEERGLVERKKSPSDARAIEVTLTDEGRARAAEIAERRKLAAADIFAVLTDEEKEQLASILDKLSAELDTHRPERHKREGAEAPEVVQA